jgi:hypothetical protein
MPAAKAFEGFVKKLLVGIGLVEADHFKTSYSNFSALNNMNDQKRRSIFNKEKQADTMLKKIDLCLKTNRHFWMHSDESESKITKVGLQEEAEERLTAYLETQKK